MEISINGAETTTKMKLQVFGSPQTFGLQRHRNKKTALGTTEPLHWIQDLVKLVEDKLITQTF